MILRKNMVYFLSLTLLASFSVKTNQNIFLNAPPKTGNHLLAKTMRLLTNKKPLHSEIAPTGKHWTHIDQNVISKAHTGFYLCSHAFASPENIEAIKKTNCKMIFMIRDPRDQLVSMAHFMKTHFDTWPSVSHLSINEIITILIHDYSILYIKDWRSGWGHHIVLTLQGIDDFYSRYLDWMKQPLVYTTTFEKLVGPAGGGSKEEQLQEIQNIADHVNHNSPQEHTEWVANNLFGTTATFRKGQIGSWKKHFTEEHKKEFKLVAGQLLIDLGYEKNLDW